MPGTYLYLLNRLLDRPFDRLVSGNGRSNLPVPPHIYLVYKVGVLAVLITLYNCTHTNQLYPYTTTCASRRTTAAATLIWRAASSRRWRRRRDQANLSVTRRTTNTDATPVDGSFRIWATRTSMNGMPTTIESIVNLGNPTA